VRHAGGREVEGFGYGPKHVRVRAEHENELTELVERERVIQERGKEKEGIRPSRW
jgi:hypothetical protein